MPGHPGDDANNAPSGPQINNQVAEKVAENQNITEDKVQKQNNTENQESEVDDGSVVSVTLDNSAVKDVLGDLRRVPGFDVRIHVIFIYRKLTSFFFMSIRLCINYLTIRQKVNKY